MNQRYPKPNEQWLPRDRTLDRVYTVTGYTASRRFLICTHNRLPIGTYYRDLTGKTINTSHDLDLTTYLRIL